MMIRDSQVEKDFFEFAKIVLLTAFITYGSIAIAVGIGVLMGDMTPGFIALSLTAIAFYNLCAGGNNG